MQELDFLILGAGWTATFLIPLLRDRQLKFAATTRDGRKVAGEDTIKWEFKAVESQSPPSDDHDLENKKRFSTLPPARCVLVTFPLKGPGQSKFLVNAYEDTHPRANHTHFIQLGSTGIWQIAQSETWITRRSPYDKKNERAIAEDELLEIGGCVLNLAGLWGGERDPKNWVDRVAKTKEDVKNKKSLHLVHGLDVARAVAAVADQWDKARGQRWMLTDGFVYDWWALFAKWSDVKEASKEIDRQPARTTVWVYELMEESDVAALPRDMEHLGRCYDSREFWQTLALSPSRVGV